MSLFVTTQSYRNDKPTEYGYLLKLSKDTGDILHKVKIDTPVTTANDRERLKPGIRGISIFRNELYVASWNNIFILDVKSLEIVRTFNHQWMSDLHGIHVDRHGIWVASSLPDAVILYDFDGRVVNSLWLPETWLYQTKCTMDKSLDWRKKGKDFRGFMEYHANHVSVQGDDVFVTGRGRGSTNGRIIRLDKHRFVSGTPMEDKEIRLFARKLHGPHDGLWTDDGHIWVTETIGTTFAQITPNGKIKKRIKVLPPNANGKLYDSFREQITFQIKEKIFGKPGKKLTHWTRGLEMDDRFIYIGQSTKAGDRRSRARIIKLDRHRLTSVDCFYLDIEDYPETRIFQLLDAKDDRG